MSKFGYLITLDIHVQSLMKSKLLSFWDSQVFCDSPVLWLDFEGEVDAVEPCVASYCPHEEVGLRFHQNIYQNHQTPLAHHRFHRFPEINLGYDMV